MMHDSKRDVANLLQEDAETRFIHERLRQKQQVQQRQNKTKRHEQERSFFAGVHFERCTPAFLLDPLPLFLGVFNSGELEIVSFYEGY